MQKDMQFKALVVAGPFLLFVFYEFGVLDLINIFVGAIIGVWGILFLANLAPKEEKKEIVLPWGRIPSEPPAIKVRFAEWWTRHERGITILLWITVAIICVGAVPLITQVMERAASGKKEDALHLLWYFAGTFCLGACALYFFSLYGNRKKPPPTK